MKDEAQDNKGKAWLQTWTDTEGMNISLSKKTGGKKKWEKKMLCKGQKEKWIWKKNNLSDGKEQREKEKAAVHNSLLPGI